MAPTQWAGGPTKLESTVSAGQTTAAYLGAKQFARRPREQLQAEFGALLASWPRDTAPGTTPPAFIEKAKALDDYKALLLESLVAAPSAAVGKHLISDLNVLHGKSGHTDNVVAFVYALVAQPAVRESLQLSGPAQRIAAAESLVEAASWLNLCDARVPTEILCAPRRLSDAEFVQYVKPRAEQSAALLEKLDLASAEVVALVRTHRGGGERAKLAQLLDLADQAAAMGAKPFFQKDGKIDDEKLGDALRANAQKAGLDPSLVDAVVSGLSDGRADAALTQARSKDLWVR